MAGKSLSFLWALKWDKKIEQRDFQRAMFDWRSIHKNWITGMIFSAENQWPDDFDKRKRRWGLKYQWGCRWLYHQLFFFHLSQLDIVSMFFGMGGSNHQAILSLDHQQKPYIYNRWVSFRLFPIPPLKAWATRNDRLNWQEPDMSKQQSHQTYGYILPTSYNYGDLHHRNGWRNRFKQYKETKENYWVLASERTMP